MRCIGRISVFAFSNITARLRRGQWVQFWGHIWNRSPANSKAYECVPGVPAVPVYFLAELGFSKNKNLPGTAGAVGTYVPIQGCVSC